MRTVINHRPRPPMCFILPGLRPLRLALRPFAIGLLLALRRQAELFLCLVLVFMNRDSQTQIVKFGFVSIDWHQLIIGSSPNQAQTQSNKILKADSLSILLRNDRGGTRTLDPRINLPHRLSPASKFYSCWFTAKRNLHVESLDYIITISGVSRLVSEADSHEPREPRLLITQSSPLFKPSQSLLPILLWRVRLSGLSSNSQHAHPAVGLFPLKALIIG